jgi:HNH endonuclease/NUMOD4 motif
MRFFHTKKKEVWEKCGVKGYRVSNYGRVKSLTRYIKHKCSHTPQWAGCWCQRGRWRKGRVLKQGKLRRLGKGKIEFFVMLGHGNPRKVHRLVAIAFIPNPENKPEVNHKDGNPSNNYYKNLEWVTHAENCAHASRIGIARGGSLPGSKNKWSKLTEEMALEIKTSNRSGAYLARKFNVSRSAISKVRVGRTWTHVHVKE